MTSRTGRSNPAAASGFTLLELVLVMLLVAVALAISAPTLRGFRQAHDLDGHARSVVALTTWARTQAVSEGRTYVLSATPVQVRTGAGLTETKDQWQATPIDADPDAPEPTSSLARFVPGDVQVELMTLDGQPLAEVEFAADGTVSPPAKFHLTGPEGVQKWVAAETRLGRFAVTDADPAETTTTTIASR